ncbi:MAG: thymidylate kinase [Ruminococcaceae bacterium]|nr:thymidylate kinase [Oscillospiraceae bacterium]
MEGRILVIEGLDGSGKETQSNILVERLKSEGIDAMKLSFPRYDEASSLFVKMYLNGEFGSSSEDINAYTASLFFALDRYVSFKKWWGEEYSKGRLIICDRYTTSNAVYQMSKLCKGDWKDFFEWLSDFEYSKLGIPKPYGVIYLDVPPEVGASLMSDRYNGDNSQKDIHEKDMDYQKKSREAALYCAETQDWEIVNCCSETGMASIDEIAKSVYERVIPMLL